MKREEIVYATKSEFKRQEIAAICDVIKFRDRDGSERLIGEHFQFRFSEVKTDEPLEVDLERMVRHKAVSAYKALLMPCIVEHAGIILQKHIEQGFPGGLTQPMMDALGAEEFIHRTNSAGEPAIARAVIGYCDGTSVRVFRGETVGVIVAEPRGAREFYWDTIFAPDSFEGRTYAEVTATCEAGIRKKMTVSQSAIAMRLFLEHRARSGFGELFVDFGG